MVSNKWQKTNLELSIKEVKEIKEILQCLEENDKNEVLRLLPDAVIDQLVKKKEKTEILRFRQIYLEKTK